MVKMISAKCVQAVAENADIAQMGNVGFERR